MLAPAHITSSGHFLTSQKARRFASRLIMSPVTLRFLAAAVTSELTNPYPLPVKY